MKFNIHLNRIEITRSQNQRKSYENLLINHKFIINVICLMNFSRAQSNWELIDPSLLNCWSTITNNIFNVIDKWLQQSTRFLSDMKMEGDKSPSFSLSMKYSIVDPNALT